MEKSILLTRSRFLKMGLEKALKAQDLPCVSTEDLEETLGFSREWRVPFIFVDLNFISEDEFGQLQSNIDSQIPLWVISKDCPKNWEGLWTKTPLNPLEFAKEVQSQYNKLR